jgi:hypothetical protein
MPKHKPTHKSNRCTKCATENPENTIQCISCGNVILAQYDNLISIATLLLLIVGNFVSSVTLGYPQRSAFVNEVAYQMFPAIAIVTLLVKLAQKQRSPGRNVVQELVALYSDVGGRLLILMLVPLVIWLLTLVNGSGQLNLEPHKVVLLQLSIGLAVSYLFLYFSHLGSAFFALNVQNAITATRDARLQLRKNAYIKKMARLSAIHKHQQYQSELDLGFFAKGYAYQFDMTPEQGEQMLQSVDPYEFSLFEAVCIKEILQLN